MSASLSRVKFVGKQAGSIDVTVDGQSFRGGNNASDRYRDVDPKFVEGLEATGLWKEVKPAAEPTKEDVATDAEQVANYAITTPAPDSTGVAPEFKGVTELAEKAEAEGVKTPAVKKATAK